MQADSTDRRDKQSENDYIFKLWCQYEGVAMHFNDLIMRLRVQALGGVAALGAIVGVLIKELPAERSRWIALAIVFFLLSILWVAIFVLDFFYYNRLLIGAVQAIVAVEAASKEGRGPNGIDLSTQIRKAVEEPDRIWRKSLRGPFAFYVLVFSVLLFILVLAGVKAVVHEEPAGAGTHLSGENLGMTAAASP